jgi:hypothetical protein
MERIEDQRRTVGVIFAVDLAAIVLFAGILGWI